jgi:hypothetical protein
VVRGRSVRRQQQDPDRRQREDRGQRNHDGAQARPLPTRSQGDQRHGKEHGQHGEQPRAELAGAAAGEQHREHRDRARREKSR